MPVFRSTAAVAAAVVSSRRSVVDGAALPLQLREEKAMWAASVVAAVEMGKGEAAPGSKLGGAAIVFNRKREVSAEGRRPGRRRSWSERRRKEI